MKTIWKYTLPKPNDEGYLTIDMPWDAIVLHISMQDDQPTLWALVDPKHDINGEVKCEARGFCLVNTGRDVPSSYARGVNYVGTCSNTSGIVWHLFDLDKRL